MLQKNIEKLVKRTQTIEVFYTPDCVWIGNTCVTAPLFNFDRLTEEQCYALFNVPEEKRKKYVVLQRGLREDETPYYRDAYPEEEPLAAAPLHVIYGGEHAVPLYTTRGVLFAAMEDLTPFIKEDDHTVFYARWAEGEYAPRIAAKSGMLLKGLIHTIEYQTQDKRFLSALEELHRRTGAVMMQGYAPDAFPVIGGDI